MNVLTTEWLQTIEAIKDVPIEQLQWLLDNSTLVKLEEGDYLFNQGDPIKGTFVVISGIIKLSIKQNNELREITNFESKSITGHLPFSRGKFSNGIGQAILPTELLFLPMKKTEEMIHNQFELTQALVHIMTSRVRDFTALEQQNEKMMALGKLSAGLAHELNNPAVAVVRGSISLKKHLHLIPETFKLIMSLKMSEEEIDIVNVKLFELLNREEKPALTLMQRSNLEDEFSDWLEANQVRNCPEIAETFVDFGFTLDDLDYFKAHIAQESLNAGFKWMNNQLITEKMVTDIVEASQRISKLVGSVKNFTHMDQGRDKQYADIHNGIRNTLTMLEHKIRKGNVEVIQNFDTTIPPVKAMIGELNQVWTNLIDNALDAMEMNGKGVLEIKTRQDKNDVKVSVIDNGSGISKEAIYKIFDPFYTTKDVGKGTGLGLDVVNRIVKSHRGSVNVNSVVNRTEFVVCFPIDN
ncbi:two-component sensor histidine kinase [Arcticibacter svalbardensis MN12-7]|uniref:histidine kinase n=1 Tax=Arcticibacter svalbardensis MN12-7 TaxID=1150600 RepID=R9GR23_9SPHI|nr:ATP-binding protein [Arcticibacter svalbardensis]EOR94287.1 two-component sensor histidine kinase [Arcticibacter svalbardensis MN12-7]